MKQKLKKVLQFITNPRLLLCIALGWMITNGWSYIMFALGTYFGVTWMTALAGGYLALLWIPATPEKLITLAIAIWLMRRLFPDDQKTLAVLRRMYRRAKILILKKKEEYRKRKSKKANNINDFKEEKPMKHPIAKIHTAKGCITVELYHEYAPNTVNSFIWAAKEQMYENRLIKRVVPGFVLQPSYCFFDDKRCDFMLAGEFEENGIKNDMKFEKGTVAMAGNGSSEAHGCEFFITLSDEAGERLQGKYAAFGKVIDGYDEVSRIENVELREVNPDGMGKAKVKQPVVDEFMTHVEVETFGEEYPKPEIKYWCE